MIPTIGRRSFLTALGIATASSLLPPLAARAQRLFKIGILYTGGVDSTFTVAFMRKLGELGYAEGKNVIIVRKSADGDIEPLRAQLRRHQRDAGNISTGPGEACHQADAHRVAIGAEHDRNRAG